MPRTIVYPHHVVQGAVVAQAAKLVVAAQDANPAVAAQAADLAAAATAESKPDDFSTKLVKYIPAEVIAFYLGAYALVSPPKPSGSAAATVSTAAAAAATGSTGWIWAVFLSGIVGTVIYLLLQQDKTKPSPWYTYVLSAIAFAVWALGTSTIATALGYQAIADHASLILAITVFLLPGLDQLLTQYLPAPKAKV